MIRRSLAATAVTFSLFGAVACIPEPPVAPVSTVDQSYADLPVDNETILRTNDSLGQTRAHAQVFTAGRTGTLDKVSAILGTNGAGPLLPVTITVESLDGAGRPSGTVLGQGVWSGPALPDTNTFADVVLTDTAEVVAGQQYALVFTNPSATGMVLYLDAPDYPGGQSWEYFTTSPSGTWAADPYDDVPFRTWVR